MAIAARETFLLKLKSPEGLEAVKGIFDELPDGIDTLVNQNAIHGINSMVIFVFGSFTVSLFAPDALYPALK